MSYTLYLSLRSFAHEHDDLPAFHAAYLVLAFLCAALFDLSVFAALVAAHIVLDVMKYREYHRCPWKQTWEGVLRENTVDVTLLFLGLLFSVYLNTSMGIAGVSASFRLVALFVPKFGILHHSHTVILHMHRYMGQVHPMFGKRFSAVELLCFVTLGISILLLLFAAPILGIGGVLSQ